MNTTERAPVSRKKKMSAEAVIGTGITIAMIGLLFAMLGWAQHMREAKEAAWMLLPLGAVLLVIGLIMAVAGGVTKHKYSEFQKVDTD